MRPGLARHGSGGQAAQQAVRVERDHGFPAAEIGGHRLDRPGAALGLRLDQDPARAELSRTGLARSATRDTRRTASVKGTAGTSARQPTRSGSGTGTG